MIVECISNRMRDIPKFVYDGLEGYNLKTELPIEIGQKSIVYGIITIKKNLWFLIDIKGLKYPMYYPSQLFKILDGRISKYWEIKEFIDRDDDNGKGLKFGFKELIDDEYFYGELLEDSQKNIEIFNKYRRIMIEEFN